MVTAAAVYTVDVLVTVVLPVVGSSPRHSQTLLMSSDVCGATDRVRVGVEVVIAAIVEVVKEDDTVVGTAEEEELDCPGQVVTFFAPIWPTPVSGTVFVTVSLR